MGSTVFTYRLSPTSLGDLLVILMNPNLAHAMALGWLAVASLAAFGLFGVDKWRAKNASKHRISEFSLLLVCAVGGWPGGLLGLILFRHKSAKPSFLFKFAAAFGCNILLVIGGLKLVTLL